VCGANELSVDQETLRQLAARSWDLFETDRVAAPDIVVDPSMPILYFGDVEAYADAPLKVVTVGLNPSLGEFPVGASWSRFPAARVNGSRPDLDTYLSSLNAYFRTTPYGWFDQGFEPILRGLGASYYDGAAIHTDICSPVATTPTWSGLKKRKALLTDASSLWRDLVGALTPDLLLISVARAHLRHLTDLPVERWRVVYTVDRANPFPVVATEAVVGGRAIPVYFGRCVHKPFGSVSAGEKERIGAAIRREIDG
jgi:hypothetical protein